MSCKSASGDKASQNQQMQQDILGDESQSDVHVPGDESSMLQIKRDVPEDEASGNQQMQRDVSGVEASWNQETQRNDLPISQNSSGTMPSIKRKHSSEADMETPDSKYLAAENRRQSPLSRSTPVRQPTGHTPQKMLFGLVCLGTRTATKPNKFCLKDILPEELHNRDLTNRDERKEIILMSLDRHFTRWDYEEKLATIDLQLPEKYAEDLENDQTMVRDILNKVAKKLDNVVEANEVSLPLLKKGTKCNLPSKLKIGVIKLVPKEDALKKDIISLMKQFEKFEPKEYKLPEYCSLNIDDLKKLRKEKQPSVYCGTKKILEGDTADTTDACTGASDSQSKPSVTYSSDVQIHQHGHSHPMPYWDLDYIHDERGYQGEDTVIAVVDSGINEYHPAFQANWNPKDPQIIYIANFCNSDTGKDVIGHGTMCAAVACGQPYQAFLPESDEVVPIPSGVAPKAKLIICKVAEGITGIQNEHIARALHWLKEIREGSKSGITVDVVSLSFGSRGFNKDIANAVTALIHAGVIVVCAASNEGHKYQQPICFPARLGNVMCIGSHDNHGKPSPFSPVGQDIDFLAPGENILAPKARSYGNIQPYSGTSCSAPAVAGLICLILECIKKEHPDLLKELHNHWMMKEILRELSTNSGMHCDDRGYGALYPKRFFSNPEAFIRLVLQELQPQIPIHAMKKSKTKTKRKPA